MCIVEDRKSILTITGSDSIGEVGVLSDIDTIKKMNALPYYAITSIVSGKTEEYMTSILSLPIDEKKSIWNLPSHAIISQIENVKDNTRIAAIKVGIVCDVDTIVLLRKVLEDDIMFRDAPPKLVLAPGIVSSEGDQMITMEVLDAWRQHLFPIASILVLKCEEAELLLDMHILSENDMLKAAQRILDMGVKSVFLRCGRFEKNVLKALLYEENRHTFFSSYNVRGWQYQCVGDVFSAAIAVNLSEKEGISTAVYNAHKYTRDNMVYTVRCGYFLREMQMKFIGLVYEHYNKSHDVRFYAEQMNMSPQFLEEIMGENPENIIVRILVDKAKQMLKNSSQSIEEIANDLGFPSKIEFMRFFKSKTGSLPSLYT